MLREHAIEEVPVMALESVHACDCPNGFTYVGEMTISKVSGGGSAPAQEEAALFNYFVIPTKMLVDRTWKMHTGEDNKVHYEYVPYATVASEIYRSLKAHGRLNKKQVKLPHPAANHELDV
jgi:hypothetical protein